MNFISTASRPIRDIRGDLHHIAIEYSRIVCGITLRYDTHLQGFLSGEANVSGAAIPPTTDDHPFPTVTDGVEYRNTGNGFRRNDGGSEYDTPVILIRIFVAIHWLAIVRYRTGTEVPPIKYGWRRRGISEE